MKNVTLAKSAGFCFGVNRAVNTVYELLEKGKKVCTFGPIIHNTQMVEELQKQGVVIANKLDEVPKDSVLVIRSHGVTKEILDKIKNMKIEFINATCPFVTKIHKIVSEQSSSGRIVLIAGDNEHPEVIGILGHCFGESYTFKNEFELLEILKNNQKLTKTPVCFAAQTTFNKNEWKKCLKTAKKLCTNANFFDTICNATSERQSEAENLAKISDLMLIIGGKHSSNTKKLFELCKSNCNQTFHLETSSDLPYDAISKAKNIGVTAGASTPAKIIKEVLDTMSEKEKSGVVETADNFEEMLEESLKNFNTDQKVRGVVVSITPTEVYVDVGRKQAGIIELSELTNDPNAKTSDLCKVGDELELLILRTNDQEGQIFLSKKRIDALKGWEDVNKALETGEVLTGVVVEQNKGGVVANVEGVRVFIPRSQATLYRSDDVTELLRKKVNLRITEINGRRKVVGSIRSVLADEKKAIQDAFWNSVEIGKTYTGTVKSLTSYGAFVDIGGVDGMIHITELSWLRIKHPSEVVKVGDTVEVYVKDINREKGNISLGYKKTEDNPWEIFKANYEVGSVVDAKIVGMVSFGAFANIIPGIDGLIHISQITDHRIEKPQSELEIGQVVKAKITAINFDEKRVSLSMRALIEEEKASAEEDSKEETTEE